MRSGQCFNNFDRILFATRPIAIAQAIAGRDDTDIPFYIGAAMDRLVEDPLTQYYGYECTAGLTEGIDDDWLEHVLLTGVGRFPWWETMGIDVSGSWWGYYGVSPDNSPIIGLNPSAERWVDACGFSGHGIMHAPATGIAVAEMITEGASRTVNVDHFAHDRFGKDIEVEANIF